MIILKYSVNKKYEKNCPLDYFNQSIILYYIRQTILDKHEILLNFTDGYYSCMEPLINDPSIFQPFMAVFEFIFSFWIFPQIQYDKINIV